jgi:hypothetical protein
VEHRPSVWRFLPLVALLACSGRTRHAAFRGPGLEVAALEVSQQAAVNAAAVSASFDPDPQSVAPDRSGIPATIGGSSGGASVAPALIAA